MCKSEQSSRGTQGCKTAEALKVWENDGIGNPWAIHANDQILLQNYVTSREAAQNNSIGGLSLKYKITVKQAVALVPLTENRICRTDHSFTLLLHM